MKWIKVKDQAPIVGEQILIAQSNISLDGKLWFPFYYTGYYVDRGPNKGFYLFGENSKIIDVTHWIPIPILKNGE